MEKRVQKIRKAVIPAAAPVQRLFSRESASWRIASQGRVYGTRRVASELEVQ